MNSPEKVIVVFPHDRSETEIEETLSAVRAAGGVVVGIFYQGRGGVDPATFVGKGKLAEIKEKLFQTGASLVLFDTFLKPSQHKNLTDYLEVNVVDRAGLILDIFARRARSDFAKLQVELAQLTYLLPRLRGKGTELSRTAGGIGTRGPGEKKLETDRRRIKERIKKIKDKLREAQRTREIHRKMRKERNLFVVSLVGYTNAGKTTLFNALAKKERATGEQIFLTLDTKFSRVYIDGVSIVLADTIGFIRDLPPFLIKAFEATLEDIKTSDLIIKVADASDNEILEKMEVVNSVLKDVGAGEIPSILALNKVDLIDERRKEYLRWMFQKEESLIFVSALKGVGIEELRGMIKEKMLCAI